jgi:uncharacterized Zn-finger protein
MADRRWGAGLVLRDHRHGEGERRCLYETALRQAIATQHALPSGDGLTFRSCEGCGKPFLLQSVWQPFSEEGELACPRCGALAISWDGTRSYVAYWHRERVMGDE